MKRLLSTLLLLIAPHVNAQFVAGQVLGAAQLNAALASPTITSGSINGAPIGQSNPKAVNATSVGVVGASSGTVSILPQSAAGTYNFNLPTTAGASGSVLTSGGGSSTPMTWTPQASLAVGTATTATNASTTLKSDNATYYPMMGTAASTTSQTFNVSSGLSFNPTVGLSVTGALSAGDGGMTGGNPTYGGDVVIKSTAGAAGINAAGGIEIKTDPSGAGYGTRMFDYFNGVSDYNFAIQRRSNSAAWTTAVTITPAGNVAVASLAVNGALDLGSGLINTYNGGASKWSYFNSVGNTMFTGSTGFYVNDQANTKNIVTVLDAAPNNALVVGTTGTDIAGNVSVSSATSGTQQALKSSNLGYSPTYKALQIGAIDSTHAISLGVDVSGNPSAGFSGNEIVIPHTSNIVAPNAANTAFWPVFSVNGSTGVMNIGNVGITGGTIDGTVIGGTTAAAGSFTTLSATGAVSGASFSAPGGSVLSKTYTAYSATGGGKYSLNSASYGFAFVQPTDSPSMSLRRDDGLTSTIVSYSLAATTYASTLAVSDTTDATGTTTASLKTAGGLGVAKTGYFGTGVVTNGGALGTDANAQFLITRATGASVAEIQSVDSTSQLMFRRAGIFDWRLVAGTGSANTLSVNSASTTYAQFSASGFSVAAPGVLQVGSGSTTSAGLIAGYQGVSGYGAIWSTGVTPSTANFALAANATSTILNADNSIQLAIDNSTVPLTVSSNTLTHTGNMVYDKTITAAGTTGAQTINKTTGRVNFAAAATSLVVTNSLATVDSICHVTKATNNATMRLGACVAGAGTLTIYADVAPDAETAVNFTVTN